MNTLSLYSKVTTLFAIWCVVVLQYYIPNMGGSGLRLPQNLIGWGVMAMLSGIIFHDRLRRRADLRYSLSFVYASVGALLLSLPLLWSPELLWQRIALTRVLAIFGALLFFYSLTQLSLTHLQKRRWAWLILAASTGQILFACVQVFYPDSLSLLEFNSLRMRPHGIFQQVNVLASFLATGLLVAVWLFSTTRSVIASLILGVSVLVHGGWLLLLQSRIGWLGALVGTAGLALVYCRRWRFILAVAMAILGTAIAGFDMPKVFHYVDKADSNFVRLTTLKYALMMISEHPWTGWGYGGFEHQFIRFVIGEGQLAGYRLNGIKHPHNELLLAGVEGGITALAGMAMLFIAWLKLAPLFVRQRIAVQHTAWWVMTLPIALHTMTEYPLYQSVPHIFVLVVLCRLALPEQHIRCHSSRGGHRLMSGVLLTGTFSTSLFMFSGIQANSVLTQTERFYLIDFHQRLEHIINPWAQAERVEYDYYVSLLMDYNETGNSAILQVYQPWAEAYLRAHNDANTYDSLIKLYQLKGDMRNAALYRGAAQLIFPEDRRFH